MKAVILAGGYGTRISEETSLKPKPMVEIGDRPILWHIMKNYANYGVTDFIICLGYKGYIVKEYFANYFLHNSNVSFDFKNNGVEYLSSKTEPWRVTLVDTGLNSMTGGRLKRISHLLSDDEPFMMTYGDGVADINIEKLLNAHKKSGQKATLTAVSPPGRFGALDISESGTVNSFLEKPRGDNTWINGGFFVLEKDVINEISGDDCVWERTPLENLTNNGQLNAFKHEGFWQPMDTLRDKNYLESLWDANDAPWRTWSE